jgi:hypothetical protein
MNTFTGRPFKSHSMLVLQTSKADVIENTMDSIAREAKSPINLVCIGDTALVIKNNGLVDLNEDTALALVNVSNFEGEQNSFVFLGTKAELNTLCLEDENFQQTFFHPEDSLEHQSFITQAVKIIKSSDSDKLNEDLSKILKPSRLDTDSLKNVNEQLKEPSKEDFQDKTKHQEIMRLMLTALAKMEGKDLSSLFSIVPNHQLEEGQLYALRDEGDTDFHALGRIVNGKFGMIGGNPFLAGINDFSAFEVAKCNSPALVEKLADKKVIGIDCCDKHKNMNSQANIISYHLYQLLLKHDADIEDMSIELLDMLASGVFDQLIQNHKDSKGASNATKH